MVGVEVLILPAALGLSRRTLLLTSSGALGQPLASAGLT